MFWSFLGLLNIENIIQFVVPLLSLTIVSIGTVITVKSYKILTTKVKFKILTTEEVKKLVNPNFVSIYIVNLSDQAIGFREGGFITRSFRNPRGIKHNFRDMGHYLTPGYVFVIQKRMNNYLQINKEGILTYFQKLNYDKKIKIQVFLIDDFGNEYRSSNSVNLCLENMELT